MNIQIKTPCSENWNAMAATEGGRFCGSCKCKVHDFTQASAEEIKQKYAENNGKLCARIYKNLAVEEFKNAAIRKGYFHNLKIFCWAALLSFGASLFSIPAAGAKTMIGQVRSEILNDDEKSRNKTASEVTIKGTVKDKESKEELIGASVVAVANDTVIAGCSADINGQYELKIDTAKYKKIDLKITYISYENNIIKDVLLSGNQILDLEMQASVLIENALPKLDRLEVIMGISIQRIEPLVPMSEPLIKGRKYKRAKAAEKNK